MPKIKNRRAIHNRIFKWFDTKERDLPWLKPCTPYRVWISEIMLQQTQIVTVIDYFNAFVDRFPTVNELATAEIDEVLRLWEGLGYYRRAHQLHKAAQVVVSEHGGQFPETFSEVLSLPGIGRYTAAAILSISLGQKQAILEGNTIRLFARLNAMMQDVSKSATQKLLWEFSEAFVSNDRPGDFNQAIMDLGREICKPRKPDCERCPIAEFCPTQIHGLQQQIPVKNSKTQYQDLHEAIVAIKRGGRYLLRRCQSGERWAGLWDFPRASLSNEHEKASICDQVGEQTGLRVEVHSLDHTIKHAVTKYRIRLDCYEAISAQGRVAAGDRFKWFSKKQIQDLPLSSTGRKFAEILI